MWQGIIAREGLDRCEGRRAPGLLHPAAGMILMLCAAFLGGCLPLAVAEDKTGCVWFSSSAGLFKRCVSATGNASVTNVLQNTQYRDHRVISLYSAVR